MRPSNNLEKVFPQEHMESCEQLTVVHNHPWNATRTRCCGRIKAVHDLFYQYWSSGIMCSFRLVQEEKTGKGIPATSRLDFLEKSPANSFVLLDAEDSQCRFTDSSIGKF